VSNDQRSKDGFSLKIRRRRWLILAQGSSLREPWGLSQKKEMVGVFQTEPDEEARTVRAATEGRPTVFLVTPPLPKVMTSGIQRDRSFPELSVLN